MTRQLATAPEWRVFEAVQPLFASAKLPWKLVDPRRSSSFQAEAANIEIKKTEDIFRSEMRFLLLNLPHHDISTQSFDLCVAGLIKLLQFLDSLILDEVITSVGALDEKIQNEEAEYEIRPQHPAPRFSDHFWGWLGYSSLDSRPNIEPSCPLSTATQEPSRTVPSNTSYGKLEALGIAVERENPDVDLCSRFLNFEVPFESFQDGALTAVRLNKRLQGLNTSQSTVGFRNAAQTVKKTRWESGAPWDMLERLFRFLVESTCSHHHARLRLNGFQVDECSSGSPPIEMFMSACPAHTYWQDCQCISVSSTLEMLASDHRVALSDVCQYIRASIARGSARLLRVEFDDQLLLYLPDHNHTSTHAGDSGMVSFEGILDHGLLREPGGILDLNDKAVLALSLARCLLHLAQGPWIQEQWTRENVKFIGKVDDIRDVWHPYITCPVAEHATCQTNPADIVPLLLSFAQLLVELETGERVSTDPSHPAFEDTIATIQEEKIDGFGRGHYNEAVTGCFRIQAALRQGIRERSDAGKDSRYLLRRVIYENIVSCLERNFSQISSRAMGTILHSLGQGKRATKSGIPVPVAVQPVANKKASHLSSSDITSCKIPSMTLPRLTHTTAAQVEVDASTSDDSSPSVTRYALNTNSSKISINIETSDFNMMFFDEESTSEETGQVRFAAKFFEFFTGFRERYIMPKVKNGRKDWPRIRIAVLDTGIKTEEIRGPLDNVSYLRKGQGCRKAARDPIKEVKSFTGEENTEDTCGHGTHVASILLRLAPDADLYIAKISTGMTFDNPDGIVSAIDWAVNEWNVDIINMSFGTSFRDTDIAQAIARAKERKPKSVILLAAASNSGRNHPRTYPASDPNVIGVHALDGYGNDNGWINPSPAEYHDNIGTLGLGISVIWDGKTVYKSGSSFASPTAAAIVANLIDWLYSMRQRGLLSNTQYNHLRQLEGIRFLLKLQGVKSGDLISVAPGNLFKPHPGDSDPDAIVCGRIKNDIQPFRMGMETNT